MSLVYSLDTLDAFVGKEIGVSDWFTIDQGRIDMFSAAHYDPDPQHTDPAWAAANTPFGGTIAYGFQTLAMLSHLTLKLRPAGGAFALNYGFDRIRFVEPVRVGSRIRARQTLVSVQTRAPGVHVIKTHNLVEIEGNPRPALVADWLGLLAAEGVDPSSI